MTNSLEPAIALNQIDPRSRYFTALGGLFLALLPLIPLWVLCVKFDWSLWLLPIYAAFAAVLVVRYAGAAHARFGYALLDDGLWLQSGVYWRKAVFVPRDRVQHTEVNHGPLDRKMGLAKLVLHTAGVQMQHLTIPGLTDAQAHALRDNLLKRAPTEVSIVPEITLPIATSTIATSSALPVAPSCVPADAIIAPVVDPQITAEAENEAAVSPQLNQAP